MMRYLICIYIVFLLSLRTVEAQDVMSLADLKAKVAGGLEYVEEDIFVQGTVISIHRCGNLDNNLNDTYTSVDPANDSRTAYVQSPDGVLGLALHFNHTADGDLPRYGTVTLNLKGTSMELVCGAGLSASGLSSENVVSVVPGTRDALVVNERCISELTDNDVYTYVRLKDCECVFKDGAYGNIYEKYALMSALNKDCKPFGTMDGWSCLLCDLEGEKINLLVNCKADWRRSGLGVQQGVFDVEGILVTSELQRYATENLSRYQLRPMSAEAFIPKDDADGWKTICEWNWNDRMAKNLQPSVGKAQLTCEVPGVSLSRSDEANNPLLITAQDNPEANGIRKGAALCISARACDWWNWNEDRGNGLTVTFSAADINASQAYVAFSFCGGRLLDAEASVDYPSFWKVEYSFDGIQWKAVEDRNVTMHSMIWKANKPIRGRSYPLSAEVGLGFSEHAFMIPENISGKDKVMVRIVPAAKNLSTYAYKGSTSRANRSDYTVMSHVNFGSLIIRYR